MAGRIYTAKPITDIFTSDTDIDRRQCRRVVPMKVLALGLGRTGTASLRHALRELGLADCYHMMSASVENPPDCLMWSDALAAKYDGTGKPFDREDWDRLLGHCQAISDWPAVAFAEELIKAYPEAKVILTTRDVDSWHASTLKTVHWRATDQELCMISNFDWAAGLYQPMLTKFWDEFWYGDFERNGKRRFSEYYAFVRTLVEKDRILEYNVNTGWQPLCHFLNVPIPVEMSSMGKVVEKQFPRSNDADGFVRRCRRRNRMQILNVAFRASLGALILALTIITIASMLFRRREQITLLTE